MDLLKEEYMYRAIAIQYVHDLTENFHKLRVVTYNSCRFEHRRGVACFYIFALEKYRCSLYCSENW